MLPPGCGLGGWGHVALELGHVLGVGDMIHSSRPMGMSLRAGGQDHFGQIALFLSRIQVAWSVYLIVEVTPFCHRVTLLLLQLTMVPSSMVGDRAGRFTFSVVWVVVVKVKPQGPRLPLLTCHWNCLLTW